MSQFSPMLAAKADLYNLSFPLMVSPKIDGIRAIVRGGVVYARSGKPIPNAHVQALFGHLHGWDGELVIGAPSAPDLFRACQSGIMSRQGESDVYFYAFDWWNEAALPYQRRYRQRLEAGMPERVRMVEQSMIYDMRQLEAYEAACLERGFEGVMLRNPDAPYKNGRSTTREGYLLKLKRFIDAEAEIIGLEELRDASGKAGGTLGAFKTRDLVSGMVFAIGTGFTAEEREQFWLAGRAMCGKVTRYRYFPTGGKNLPRFPVFSGLRDVRDMGAKHA